LTERVVEHVRRRVAGRHDDRPRVDGHPRPQLECEVAAESGHGLLQGERRPHGPLGVVLVRQRGAEEREHAVAG
jgi:hypothetical protein